MADPILALNSIDLRDAADYASSLRGPDGNPIFLVTTPGGDGGLSINPTKDFLPCSTPTNNSVACSTMTVQPDRPTVDSVTIQAAESPVEGLDRYDAVFWSEAAVEKFVIPYYASKWQWEAATLLSVLSNVWYGFVPPAGKTSVEITPTEPDDGIPFALAHLPRSEYVVLGGGDVETHHGGVVAPHSDIRGRDLVLLVRHPDGTVSHRPLSYYL
jgi:hypothetical protein